MSSATYFKIGWTNGMTIWKKTANSSSYFSNKATNFKLCDNYPDKSNLGTVYKVKFAYKSSHPSSQSLSQFLYKAQTN